ncbi:slc38a6, partial [Symbiodinium microadriaticum]
MAARAQRAQVPASPKAPAVLGRFADFERVVLLPPCATHWSQQHSPAPEEKAGMTVGGRKQDDKTGRRSLESLGQNWDRLAERLNHDPHGSDGSAAACSGHDRGGGPYSSLPKLDRYIANYARHSAMSNFLVRKPATKLREDPFRRLRAMAAVLRHSPRAREPELQLLQRVVSDACRGYLAWPKEPADLTSRIAELIGKERPDLFVLVLPGPCAADAQDMFGEGFDIFAELQVQPQLVAIVLARSSKAGPSAAPSPMAPQQDASRGAEVLLHTVRGGHAAQMQRAVSAALQVEESQGSRASECYFALARLLDFKLDLFVLWRRASAPASSFNAAGERLALRVGSAVVDIFIFADMLEPTKIEKRLVLAPTGAGKSTWRTHAPVFCPEGEVLDEVTFHPAYHRPVRLKHGSWLKSEEPAPSIFLRDLRLLRRWLRADSRRRVTFNCSGEVLETACELKLLRPEEVCVVLPHEVVHHRFISARKAALDGVPRTKKLKVDPSLSQWEAGPQLNREMLRTAAEKCGISAYSSFAGAMGASVHIFCMLRRHQGSSEEPFLVEPALEQLQAKHDLTMACGRRIVDWISKGGGVAESSDLQGAGERAVWQVSAEFCDSDTYIVKSTSGFLLLTDGRTLISAEDPYREASEVFWSRSSDEAETAEESFWLCGRDAGLRLHARRCTGCASFDPPGPWRHVLPVDRLADEGDVILWYPGSFAPFHVGHLDCLRAARHGLQQSGIKVAGAYAKPQMPRSLRYKKLDEHGASIFSSGPVRLRLLELVAAQEDWVMADPYGVLRGTGNNFQDLRAFRANLTASLARLGSGARCRAEWASSVEIVWVIGDDAFPHLRDKLLSREDVPKDDALKQVGPMRMCVVHNRPSQWTALGPGTEGLPFPVIEVTAPPEFSADLSATAVRQKWRQRASE